MPRKPECNAFQNDFGGRLIDVLREPMASQIESLERWSLPIAFNPESLIGAIDAFTTEFYASLEQDPRHGAAVRALSADQLRILQQAQKKHLQYLLSLHLDPKQWQEAAHRMGREQYRHHILSDWPSKIYQSYARHLASHLDTLQLSAEERSQLLSLLIGRLLHDLSMQTAAYSEARESAHRLRELSAKLDQLLLSVTSIDTLYPRLAEFLLKTVAIDGLWLGTPSHDGTIHNAFAYGDGVTEYLTGNVIHLRENLHSPLLRSWKTGEPEYTNNWADPDEPGPTAFWRERGLRFGWRSSCAIPVTGTREQREILVLYSKQINFFAPQEIRQLVAHLHALLGIALERLRLMKSLQQKQQTLSLYKTAMDASANGILIADATTSDLPIQYVNPAFERITGYTQEESVGKNCRFLQGTDTAQPQLDVLREALRKGEACALEIKNYRKNGSMFWNSLTIAPVRDDAGSIAHFIGIQNDITNLKTALARDARTNALYRALMGAAELVVRAQNERELLDDLCHLLVESGLFPHVWIGKPNASGDIEVLSIFSRIQSTKYWYRPNVHTDDENRILTVRAWRHSQLQYTNDRLTDPEYPVIQNFYREHGLHATAVLPLYRDGELWALLTLLSHEANIFNTELLELLERIGRLVGHGLDSLDLRQILDEERQHQAWLARHDPLTDILNRRGLMERLEESVARTRRHKSLLAVAVMDLDGFKVVNDLHGHPAGDLLLRTIAERLQSTLRQTDAVGRMGGDEFVLILEDLEQEEDLAIMLARVLAAVESPIHLSNGRTTAVRTSTGVTIFPQDDALPEQLLRHADRALYTLKEDKEEPEQRWMLYQAQADERKFLRQKTILALFRAGNIRVYYQPVINLQTGRVSGVEALARLVDQDNNLLLPAEFLPQLSASDLTTLTHRVLAQSIQDLQLVGKTGFCLNVGINLEPSTLADPKAIDDLRRQIESSGLGPSRIILELLERADTLSVVGTQQALRDLKSGGARIALDDVGSAYSSLLRVKELPVDVIKLDRSFVVGLEQHPNQLRFLMNLVHMVQSLGLDLVVEGVESSATSDALAAFGARYAQGYCIGRPMDLPGLLQWLKQHKPMPWTKPASLLGAVALQLSGLDAVARILPQRPAYLNYMPDCDADKDCLIGTQMNALGAPASRMAEAHRAWHAALAAICIRSGGTIRPADFEAVRAAYEEELFQAVLDAHPQQK